jgi:hypothetical protein
MDEDGVLATRILTSGTWARDGKIAAEVRFDKLVQLTKNGFISQHVFLDHSHTPDEKSAE